MQPRKMRIASIDMVEAVQAEPSRSLSRYRLFLGAMQIAFTVVGLTAITLGGLLRVCFGTRSDMR